MIRSALTTRRALALAAAAALLLTGCGGSDDGDAASETTATTEAAPTTSTEPSESEAGETSASESEAQSQEITVAAVDFGYELPSTEFSAGEVTIELVNEGDASHNIVVERDGEDVATSDIIDGGATTTLTVTLEPGEYILYCSVGSHRAMGMEVPITVT